MKRITCIFLVIVCFAYAYLPLPTSAKQRMESTSVTQMRATNDFTVTIPAGSSKSLHTAIPLTSGEKVTIQAHYLPKDAGVDFGLIYPDGTFHYVSASGGHINTTLTVGNPGDYKLAILNNSSQTITVAGYIKY